MSYDPPSEPPDNRPQPSVRGASVVWEECEVCEGEGCTNCDFVGGFWVEDFPEWDE